MTRAGVTIEQCTSRMRAALAQVRHGETPKAREAAVTDLDAAIADACRLPSATWRDAQAKAEMARVALMGRNAAAACRIVTSLARDLEHLPHKGARPC